MRITSDTHDKIMDYYVAEYGRVFPPQLDLEVLIKNTLGDQVLKNQYNLLDKVVDMKKDHKILDFGSGLGGFTVYLRSKGFVTDGYEIDSELFGIANDLDSTKTRGSFLYSRDGTVPSDNSQYDLVFSHFVFEHVSDSRQYFSEGLRVLKPGGHFFLVTCNHILGYEFHYAMWLPLFSKGLSKWILSKKDRDTRLIDVLNIVTPYKINDVLRKLQKKEPNFEIENIGQRLFIDQALDVQVHSEKFVSAARVLDRVGALKIAQHVGLYNPLIYLITKLK